MRVYGLLRFDLVYDFELGVKYLKAAPQANDARREVNQALEPWQSFLPVVSVKDVYRMDLIDPKGRVTVIKLSL